MLQLTRYKSQHQQSFIFKNKFIALEFVDFFFHYQQHLPDIIFPRTIRLIFNYRTKSENSNLESRIKLKILITVRLFYFQTLQAMGNIENCTIVKKEPKGSQIIINPDSTQSNFNKQRTNELKAYDKENLPEKVQFFYVKPILLQKTIQIEVQPPVLQKSHKQSQKTQNIKASKSQMSRSKARKSQDNKNNEQDNDLERLENAFRKISVQWNSFAKIKKKRYLEDYIFIKEIGRGAYGSVCKLKMKYGGLQRAAKIINASAVLRQKQSEQKFFAEIALPMQLDHPNIIKLFQVFEWKKQFVLIMQLCEGGDLFHRIKENKIFSQKKASEIMKQILSAIFYMHKKNVMHRDIKPQNMLYDMESKALKIIDFGTATKFNPGQKMKSLVGTPYYIAPQVIKGEYDQKCDVWSCGVILYIMLCGYPPFNGKNEKEIMQKITMQPIDFSTQVWNKRSSKAKQLISKMLAKRPEDRITAQQALNSEWMQSAPTEIGQNQIGQEVCKNLKSFHFQNKLKAVVYTYIASQLYSNKDKEKLLKAFREMDKDGDGVIGKEQLMRVFNTHSSSSLNPSQIQKILEIVDTNGSGLIDFTQFLVAASNEQKILEKQRLQNAFNYLDTDHSGYISIEEVKAFLDGSQQTGEQIKNIFNQVDENGDGTISKKEFLALLLKKQDPV